MIKLRDILSEFYGSELFADPVGYANAVRTNWENEKRLLLKKFGVTDPEMEKGDHYMLDKIFNNPDEFMKRAANIDLIEPPLSPKGKRALARLWRTFSKYEKNTDAENWFLRSLKLYTGYPANMTIKQDVAKYLERLQKAKNKFPELLDPSKDTEFVPIAGHYYRGMTLPLSVFMFYSKNLKPSRMGGVVDSQPVLEATLELDMPIKNVEKRGFLSFSLNPKITAGFTKQDLNISALRKPEEIYIPVVVAIPSDNDDFVVSPSLIDTLSEYPGEQETFFIGKQIPAGSKIIFTRSVMLRLAREVLKSTYPLLDVGISVRPEYMNMSAVDIAKSEGVTLQDMPPRNRQQLYTWASRPQPRVNIPTFIKFFKRNAEKLKDLLGDTGRPGFALAGTGAMKSDEVSDNDPMVETPYTIDAGPFRDTAYGFKGPPGANY